MIPRILLNDLLYVPFILRKGRTTVDLFFTPGTSRKYHDFVGATPVSFAATSSIAFGVL